MFVNKMKVTAAFLLVLALLAGGGTLTYQKLVGGQEGPAQDASPKTRVKVHSEQTGQPKTDTEVAQRSVVTDCVPPPAKQGKIPDGDDLEGVWTTKYKQTWWTIAGNKLLVWPGPTIFRYELHPHKQPKQIDLEIIGGPYATPVGAKYKGIYRLKGDQLEISFVEAKKGRPKELKKDDPAYRLLKRELRWAPFVVP